MVHSMKYLFIVTPIVHGCQSLMIAFRIHFGLSFVKLSLYRVEYFDNDNGIIIVPEFITK